MYGEFDKGTRCVGRPKLRYKDTCKTILKSGRILDQWQDLVVKVIPQKKKFPINFFETFPEYSPPSIVSKKTIKMIGHHSRLRDMMG